MAFYIGIDGGATKTILVVTDENLNIITRVSGGKTNPVLIGTEKSAQILFKMIQTAVTKSKILSVDSVVAGLAGCGRKDTSEDVKKKLEALLLSSNVKIKTVHVLSDAEITLEGSFPNSQGAILIAGTGSIAFGKNDKGKIFRSGGFGKLLGDEGSGYSIGKEGLIAAANSFDGRGQKSLFEKYLKENFKISDSDTLILKVHSKNFDIASLAEYVIKAADEGDKVCRKILERESEKMLDIVYSLKKKISTRKLNLSLWGGLLSNKNYYSTLIKRKIKKSSDEIALSSPVYTPELGAVLIALRYNKLNGMKIRK